MTDIEEQVYVEATSLGLFSNRESNGRQLYFISVNEQVPQAGKELVLMFVVSEL